MTKGDLIDVKKKRELFSDYLINIDAITKIVDDSFDLKESMKRLRQNYSFANKAIQDMSNTAIEHMTHEEYKNRLRPFDGLGILNNSSFSAKEDYEFDRNKDHSSTFQYLKIISTLLAGTIFIDVNDNPRIYPNSSRYKGQFTRENHADEKILAEELPEKISGQFRTFTDKFKRSETKYKDMSELKEMLFNNFIFAYAEENKIISKDKSGTNTRFEQISFFATKRTNPTRTEEAAIKIAKGLWDELSEQEKTGNPIQIDDSYVEDLFRRTAGIIAALMIIRKRSA